MAETQFEDDLRSMFAQAPPPPDAAAFAGRVEARIMRRGWLRAGLISVLGVLGVAIAWLWFGLSPADFNLSLPTIRSVAGPDNAGLWALGVLVLALALVVFQSAAAEA